MERKTIFSACREYRYCLWREWGTANSAYAMFVGLNPSTADENKDDPTIRRCVDYAKQWGYGALCMTNLFAYKATKPSVMKMYPVPVGPDNDRWLLDLAKDAGIIIAAWGVNGVHLKRDQVVIHLLAGKLSCLQKSKRGHPRHPLFLKKTVKPLPFA